jgi:hypothetical protein
MGIDYPLRSACHTRTEPDAPPTAACRGLAWSTCDADDHPVVNQPDVVRSPYALVVRRLFRYLNTAPLPAAVATQLLLTVTLVAVAGWPALPATSGRAFLSTGWGLIVSAVATVAERRQQQQATGWTPTHRADLIDRLRDGEAPVDPEDRQRLAMTLATGIANRRGLDWVTLVAWLAIASLPLLRADRYPGRTEWLATGWLLAAAGVLFTLSRRAHRRRRDLLAQLEAADQPDDATR